MFEIPLFDLNFDEAEEEAVLSTLRSKWISMGPKCNELEHIFCEMLGVEHACAVTSCTAALHLACCALQIGEGDEVICPSLSFAATVNCIRYVGATPVFADIVGNDNLCIDPDQIEALITERTKAVIVMHFGGFACDMDRVMEIAKKYGIYVIEDACHGPLSEYKGRKLGTIGDVSCFSFFSNKNISTGEGGMVITNNQKIYEKIKLLRSHGMTTMSYQRATGHATSYDVVELGYNYRMDDIRASIGVIQMKKLQEDLKKRIQIREWYIRELEDADFIEIPFKNNTEFVSNYIFPIVLIDASIEQRDLLREKLQEKGIQTSIHYPAIHRFLIYQQYTRELPKTEYVSDHEITLPMYAKLTEEQITYICDTLKDLWAEMQ